MLVKKKRIKKENDVFENIPTIMDMILPDAIKENKDYIYLGFNKYTRYFVMTIYPEQTWIGWLQDLSYIGNINISTNIEPASSSMVINQLTRKLVQVQAEYATYMRQGNIAHTPELEKTISDLEDLRSLIQTNQDKLFFATIFISLTCETLEELTEKTKILETEINKKTAKIRVLTFRQLEALKKNLPVGNSPIEEYERNMVSGGVSTLIPVSNPNVSHNEGVFLGRNYYTNVPVYLDIFTGPPSLPNPHVFVCGTSGAGKSVALKLLSERNIVTNSSSAFFIDVEGEYSKLVRKLRRKSYKNNARRNNRNKSV